MKPSKEYLFTIWCYPHKEGENSVEVQVVAKSREEAIKEAKKISVSKEAYVKSIQFYQHNKQT